ncbi:MAG: ribonuclease HI [halophilic archaeon J07HX5]|nr:MAG: ribonuclease HI [halophilic archaeon J07HX5]
MPVIQCDPRQARRRLEAADVTVADGNTQHELWRADHAGATAVAYDEKVVVQGAKTGRLEGVLRDGDGRVSVYVDGASRGNPGPAAIGWVLITDGGVLTEGGQRIGATTNNRAEYRALVHAVEVASESGFGTVDIHSDSELVVRQVTGEWAVNEPALRELRVRARELLEEFDDWSLSHVPRELNERADKLANEAFDG